MKSKLLRDWGKISGGFFESQTSLIKFVDNLEQVANAFCRFTVEFIPFLFVVDNKTPFRLV